MPVNIYPLNLYFQGKHFESKKKAHWEQLSCKESILKAKKKQKESVLKKPDLPWSPEKCFVFALKVLWFQINLLEKWLICALKTVEILFICLNCAWFLVDFKISKIPLNNYRARQRCVHKTQFCIPSTRLGRSLIPRNSTSKKNNGIFSEKKWILTYWVNKGMFAVITELP